MKLFVHVATKMVGSECLAVSNEYLTLLRILLLADLNGRMSIEFMGHNNIPQSESYETEG